MKRQQYVQPESIIVPFSSCNVMDGIGGSTGTSVVYGKETILEEESFEGYNLWEDEPWGDYTEDNH